MITDPVMFAICSLLIGLSKGGLGGPVPGGLVVPLLATTMPVADSVGIVLPLLILADIFALRIYWRKWNMHYIKLLLPFAIIGVVMGSLLLAALSDYDDLLRLILGITTLVIVIYKLASDRIAQLAYESRNWHGWLAGWVTGFGSSLANTGGPQFTIYMLLQQVKPIPFIGTATLTFATLNLTKLPAFIALDVLDVNSLAGILWAVPIVPLGVYLGRRALDWIDKTTFERLLMVLLVIVAVQLIVTALT